MKHLSGNVLALEVRITPYDQKEVTVSPDDFKWFNKLILCAEGSPNGSPQLHYHGYVETVKSETWLRSFLRKIAHAPDNEKINGNALYFTRKPHEHTFGYIVKCNNVTVRHGITEGEVDQWVKESHQYEKDKATERKRKQRSRDKQLNDVVKILAEELQSGVVRRQAVYMVDRILQLCDINEIRFPTRSQMEMIVLRLMYSYDSDVVRSFYMKSFHFL